jgi:hypothetical protein
MNGPQSPSYPLERREDEARFIRSRRGPAPGLAMTRTLATRRRAVAALKRRPTHAELDAAFRFYESMRTEGEPPGA